MAEEQVFEAGDGSGIEAAEPATEGTWEVAPRGGIIPSNACSCDEGVRGPGSVAGRGNGDGSGGVPRGKRVGKPGRVLVSNGTGTPLGKA